ncbi:ribose transport system substrate-binding protein [Actinomadura coerulea]|uniref:Ribose transport system substrate-binding protein n=1 Tax=Actinomadura coerulea TaxID=46159 RepID=A0A7X0FZ25_9ACTN|nr:substrate-binding domain-containing protein [Actinomadura coerulea]MBB6395710.1 ribose transport system substrate-binding protein [Actinomadura coerulea]GGQ26573.1 sugar ABC transporter substrate-binding protein [Actinomadura coerulea]
MYRWKGAAVLLAGALALGGCASGEGSGSGAPAGEAGGSIVPEAVKAVTAGSAPVTSLTLPDKSPKAPRNKRIVAVTCTNEGDGCPLSAQAVGEATRQFGWEVKVIDGKGDPAVWNSAILNAITTKADAIVLSAVAPALVKDALAKAKAADIPVVTMFQPVVAGDGIYGHVRPDHPAQGELAANWIIADSKGKAKVIEVVDAEFVELGQRSTAFNSRLKKCGGCEVVATVNSTLATLSTRLPGAITAALQKHPDADYVVGATDNHSLFASQGIQMAGRAGAVKLVGYDGNSPNYRLVRTGVQAMDIVESYSLQGWLAADLLIRALSGEPGRDYVLPSRLFTKGTMPAELWETEADFRKHLTERWTKGTAAND